MSTIAAFQKILADAKTEVTAAETELAKAQKKLDGTKPSAITRPAVQKEFDAAQVKLTTRRLKLNALERAETALREQEPIQSMIDELKRQLEAIPNPGTDLENSLRVILEGKIVALEKARLALKVPPIPSPENPCKAQIVWMWISLAALTLFLVLRCCFPCRKSRVTAAKEGDGEPRVNLARTVTLGAMTFILLVTGVTLLFTGIYAVTPPSDEKKVQVFFDVAKWVLGAVLPVVGAWVGTVMAFYFGKESLKAVSDNAEKIITKLGSPQEKLESRKAGESGIEIDQNTAVHRITKASLETEDLNDIKKSYSKDGGKTFFERLPILNADGSAAACLHYSTLTKYLSNTDQTVATNMTLGALIKKLNWEPAKSFATLLSTDTLAAAQMRMKDSKECSDIFVTADGTPSTLAKRWITNDDILKVAQA